MAKIELVSKPVKYFKLMGQSAPQHLYIVHTKDNGEKFAYRGGPEHGNELRNWLLDDLKVSHLLYDGKHPDREDLKKTGPHTRKTLVEGTDAEISTYTDKMIDTMQRINKGNFDYKVAAVSVGSWQNSNTVARYLIESAGLKFELPTYADGKAILAPGWNEAIHHTWTDENIVKKTREVYEGLEKRLADLLEQHDAKVVRIKEDIAQNAGFELEELDNKIAEAITQIGTATTVPVINTEDDTPSTQQDHYNLLSNICLINKLDLNDAVKTLMTAVGKLQDNEERKETELGIMSEFGFGRADYPSVAGLSNGNFVVVWLSIGQISGFRTGINDLYGQILDPFGHEIGSIFEIDSHVRGNQYFPSVAELSNGKFVVNWESVAQSYSGWGIYGKIFDLFGHEIGSRFRVDIYTKYMVDKSQSATLSNGNSVIVKSSCNDSECYVNGQIIKIFDPYAHKTDTWVGTCNEFYYELARRESSNNPTLINHSGFGLYQFEQKALMGVLIDMGYFSRKTGWTGKDGINSHEDFLSNPDVQTKAVKEYHIIIWDRYLKNYHAYEGQEIGGIKLTKSGMIACSHLGYDKLISFIDSNGKIDEADDFGTKCTKYLHELAGYDLDCLTIGYSKDLTVGDSQEVKEDL